MINFDNSLNGRNLGVVVEWVTLKPAETEKSLVSQGCTLQGIGSEAICFAKEYLREYSYIIQVLKEETVWYAKLCEFGLWTLPTSNDN